MTAERYINADKPCQFDWFFRLNRNERKSVSETDSAASVRDAGTAANREATERQTDQKVFRRELLR